jgi:4-hydroxybenzoate polyprenyltransferase
MRIGTALRLGRVSNIPTVWTNVVAGVALSSIETAWRAVVPVGVAASLLYVAGMFLNDAFDRRWDAQHRPERPIPAGEVSAREVFGAGFGMMAAALLLIAATTNMYAVFAGLVLAGLILLYDVSHKGNRFAPAVMGLCRVTVYGVAASAAGATFALPVVVGAGLLFLYLVTLTAIARREPTNPKLPHLVGGLIAGISLVDAVLLLVVGQPRAALACALAFPVTLALQKRVAGT